MIQSSSPFVWYELTTTDTAAAAAFYRSVVGWETRDSGMPGMHYMLLQAAGVEIGGVMDLPDELRAMHLPPCWTGYVGVSDVDGYVSRVTTAGGHVKREPQDIPGVGRFAVVTDPDGAAFILFKGNSDQSPAPKGHETPGHQGNRGRRQGGHGSPGSTRWQLDCELHRPAGCSVCLGGTTALMAGNSRSGNFKSVRFLLESKIQKTDAPDQKHND